MRVPGVLRAGPEEAAQAVLVAARYDVDVQVGYALADSVVHGDEAAVRFEPRLDCTRDQLRIGEKRAHEGLGYVEQRLVVLPRDQQAVTGEERAAVEALAAAGNGSPRDHLGV